MTCLDPLTPDEFTNWYRHLGRLRLFWSKPLVELFHLYRFVEGCVIKVRWASEKPRLEEAYIAILRKMRKLDFLAQLRGTKILITPAEVERELYQQRGSLYIYLTTRPCATGIYLEGAVEGHPEPTPDHVILASGKEDFKYLVYLNKWNFNIDYIWLASPEFSDKAIESAICEARRLGSRYATLALGDEGSKIYYKPDYFYNVFKLAF